MSLCIEVHRLSSPAGVLVRDLQLEIAPGHVHTLMGPSGCGKSSLLAAVCGTLDAALQFEGSVRLNGVLLDPLPTQARRVGILFQDDLLFAHMTVRENLLFACPRGAQTAREVREEQVLQALHDVELGDTLHADPASLSGGQRARVALARALLAQPQALLLDEAFSRLDAALRQRMRTLVFSMVQARGIPALQVTHDAQDVADTALLTHLG